MNFIRSPDGVMATGPAPRLSRFQLARAVSLLSLPGAATIATSCLPSALMVTDWMVGILAKSSAGRGLARAGAMHSAASAAAPRRAGDKRSSMVGRVLVAGTSI